MAGDWCTWCGLSAKEWSPADHDKGELWTLEAMAAVCESISLGVTNDTLAGHQEFVDEPLRSCIPITSYILPVLHTEIGIGNRLLKSFLDWLDLRIESVPDDEFEARYKVYEANTEVQKQTEIWDEWVDLKGRLLADLRQERAMINHTKTQRDDEGKFVHSAAERKEMPEASKARSDEVKPLEREKKSIRAQLETYKKISASRTKALNKLRQRRDHGDSPIKNNLEKILAILGIDRAAYPRGDLNGKNVHQMFQESDSIFLQFQELLLGVDEEDGNAETRRSSMPFVGTLSCVRYLTICSPWLGHQLGC
jgi:hypothetical protein